MPAAVADAPVLEMQGIAVPGAVVDPREFFRRTRRNIIAQRSTSYQGLGNGENVSVNQVGIIAGLYLKLTGTLTVTANTGTVASRARWPYDVIKALRFAANGQANLINVGGHELKVRDILGRGDLTDRSVSRGIGGASPGTARTNGTLSQANESWGVGQNVTAIPTGAYPVELNFFVPVAMNRLDLIGAIFAQTSSTDLSLAIDWAPQSDLFTLTADATVALALTYTVHVEFYSIPQAGTGEIILPDLSTFHSLIKTRFPNPANGLNEIRLAGQGMGRALERLWFRTFNGAVPVPLPVNDTNYGQIGWRYGGNDTPEAWTSGLQNAYWSERTANADLGSTQGVALLDWCSEFAFRDSIDEGAATELRFLAEIQSGVALVSPFIEYTQETLFAGSAGA